WPEYFPALRDDTTALFKLWVDDPEVRGDPEMKNAKPQIPQAFKLGGGPIVGKNGKDFLVVSLINRTDKAVMFEYRWSGEPGWKEGKLPPGGQVHYARPAAGPSDQSVLEARLKGSENVTRMEANRWSGNGAPTFADGRKWNWKPRK